MSHSFWGLIISISADRTNSPDNEKTRDRFEKLVQELITRRKVDAIGEEAGDDRAVWEHLKAEEAATPEELKSLFVGLDIVDEPTETIARKAIQSAKCLYADIRPPSTEAISVQEHDEAMALACARLHHDSESDGRRWRCAQ